MPRRPAANPADPPINKLNIYLLKKVATAAGDFVQIEADTIITQLQTGILYHKRSFPQNPEWLTSFFLNDPNIPEADFLVSGTSAVLICKIAIGTGHRFFAVPFGSGRWLLKENAIEEGFGLKTAVNLAEEDKVRALDKRVLGSNTKLTREQLSKVGTTTEFGIDIERDLLHGITAETINPIFGKTIVGKDAFTVSTKVDINSIHALLYKCYQYYTKDTYKEKFPWIDLLKEVTDPLKIEELNGKLVENIKNHEDQVWLAVPEIVDWAAVRGFKYSLRRKDDLYDDLTLHDFLEETELADALTTDDLYSHRISCWSLDGTEIEKSWEVFRCLNTEMKVQRKLYILSSGKWYDVAPTFLAEINTAVNKITGANITFPPYDHEDENAYNITLATGLGAYCLDAKNIIYGGGRSRIEFCDVLAPGRKLIHLKKYGGSSVLSHLFNQGMVSAELFARDQEFRKLLRTKLPNGPFKDMIPLAKPNASQYKIVFGIIGNRSDTGEINLPFFSKVALRRCYNMLTGFSFHVHVNFIPLADAAVDEAEEN